MNKLLTVRRITMNIDYAVATLRDLSCVGGGNSRIRVEVCKLCSRLGLLDSYMVERASREETFVQSGSSSRVFIQMRGIWLP